MTGNNVNTKSIIYYIWLNCLNCQLRMEESAE